MPFKKGKPKTGGKKKGTVNKKTLVLNTFAETIVKGGMDKFQFELRKLSGQAYINAYLQLFEYVKPKLSRMEMKAEVDQTIKPMLDLTKLSDEELRTLDALQRKSRVSEA